MFVIIFNWYVKRSQQCGGGKQCLNSVNLVQHKNVQKYNCETYVFVVLSVITLGIIFHPSATNGAVCLKMLQFEWLRVPPTHMYLSALAVLSVTRASVLHQCAFVQQVSPSQHVDKQVAGTSCSLQVACDQPKRC